MGAGRRVLATLLLLAAGTVAPAEARELRLSHQWAAEVDARDRAARVFVAELAKRAPDLKITIHPQSKLGLKPVEQFDALLDGRAELAIYPLFYATQKVPEFSIGLLPGVPASSELAMLLKGSEFEARLQALAMDKGVRILTWWWLGGGIASRSQAIAGPASVEGLAVRGGDRAFDRMLAAAGGNVLSMPSTEIARKMSEGALDAALTSFESFVSFKIYEQAKHATLGGYGIWTSFQPLIMARSVWDQLTETEQRAVEDAALLSDAYFEATQRDALKTAVEAFSKAGARVKELSYDDYAAWLAVAKDSSWEDYRNISPAAAELFTAMLQSFIDSDKRKVRGLSAAARGLKPKGSE